MGRVHRRITSGGPFSKAILEAKQADRVPVIVDIKPVSPRDGDLLNQRTPGDLGRLIEAAGACATSVVTESRHFGGSVDMLREVAASCNLPVLQKDFFSSIDQVEESHNAGAVAFLIILSMTPDDVALKIYERGRELGMEAVVEIHTANELKRALKLDPTIIGINNRDISRLELDEGSVAVTEKLVSLVPEPIITISESSLLTKDDVKRAVLAGADAVLIGTAILKANDLKAGLAALTGF